MLGFTAMMARYLFLTLCLLDLPLQAAYITDRIAVGLYKDPPKGNAAHIAVLYSGAEIKQVLEQKNGFVKIELTDGRTGWIGRQYLSEEVPAVQELIESRKQVQQLTQELEQARTASTAATPNAPPAEAALKQELSTAYKKLAEVETKLKEKTAKPSPAKPSSPAECEQQLEAMESKQLQCQVRLAKYTKDDQNSVTAENEKLREIMQQAVNLLNLPPNGEVPLMVPASALASISLGQAPTTTNAPAANAETTQDRLPSWVYLIFVLALITGLIAGFALFDYRSRLRNPL